MSIVFNYNGVAAMYANWLWSDDVKLMKKCTYDQNVARGRIMRLNRGAADTPAIIRYDNLPYKLQQAIENKLTSMGKCSKVTTPAGGETISFFESHIKPDKNAQDFFADYTYNDNIHLSPDTQNEYYTNAILLNAFNEVLVLRKGQRNACGITGNKSRGLFTSVLNELNALNKDKYPHSLPNTERNLRPKLKAYLIDGYASLIHSNFGNQHARKVTEDLERLIISLYCQGNNPYADWVAAQYLQFLAGTIDVVDTKTGLMFDNRDFYNEKNEPLVISEGTVWNIINNPANRVTIDSVRMSYHTFGAMSRPHYQRHNALYSLSKVSLDDRDLPRKMHDGNRVKAYYAYDVCSGALIGMSYSRKKDADLFIGCLKDMFRTLDRLHLGLPLEMEVENHLVRQYEDDLMRAGNLFPFVRWCAPTNSQEKHAEQFNRQKKYGYEKRYQDGIGRWYAKNPSNRTEGERVYDDNLDKYIIKEKTYSYEQLIADDRQTAEAYNNGLHRDQKRYPGKTRMEVFMENLNPELTEINRPLLLRYIGNCTTTTIQRNQYLQVHYSDYQLSSPTVLQQLKPGNYTVQAYWLADTDGNVTDVYVYQNDRYICASKKIETFTTAQAEWTAGDTEAMTKQAKYIAQFDKMAKKGKNDLHNVKIYPKTNYDSLIPEIVETEPAPAENMDNYEELINKFNPENYKEYAIEMV